MERKIRKRKDEKYVLIFVLFHRKGKKKNQIYGHHLYIEENTFVKIIQTHSLILISV